MGYGRYLVIRSLNAFITLFIVTLLISALFNVVIDMYAEAWIREQLQADLQGYIREHPTATQEQIQEYLKSRERIYRARWMLDKPLVYRILLRTFNAMIFKFDPALQLTAPDGSRDTVKIILGRLPNTIVLFLTSTIVTAIIGIYIGLKAARSAGSLLDKSVAAFALITNSVPMWWTGMLFILIFAYYIPIFPPGGTHSIPPPPPGLPSILDFLWHLALPLITVTFVSFGGWAYVVRNIVIDVMTQDFVLVARAKGLPESRILYGHVLRAAAPPIVTIIILSVLSSLSGAIITETVFNWPGMGMLYWAAISTNDLPVIIAEGYVFTFLFVIAMLIADLIYGVLDPRVKVGW